jgi:hypothetical protein
MRVNALGTCEAERSSREDRAHVPNRCMLRHSVGTRFARGKSSYPVRAAGKNGRESGQVPAGSGLDVQGSGRTYRGQSRESPLSELQRGEHASACSLALPFGR